MNDMTPMSDLHLQGQAESSQYDQIDQMMQLIVDCLPVDSVQYPRLGEASDEPIANFCVRHSALHFSKTAGQLAEVAEAIDHGASLHQQVVAKIAVNSVINAFKLASEVGLSSDEIMTAINQKFSR